MFSHLQKTLLFPLSSLCSSSSSSPSSQVQIRTRRIRFQVRSSWLPLPLPLPYKRVVEDEYNVRVSVLWDFNTCPVPSQVSYLKVPPSIIGAVRTNGFMGPIQIEAYGYVYKLSDNNQELLFLNGVDLFHIPGEKNGSDRHLKDWISMNPQSAHLFLITGNRNPDFVCTVRHLSLNNYKILYACPGRADDYLCSASMKTLEWSSIVKGEYLIVNDKSAETYNKSSTFFSNKSDDLTANQDQDVIHTRKPELFEDSMFAEVDHTVSHFEKPKSPPCKRVDAGDIRVSVWWNFDDCRVPPGVSVLKVPALIMAAIRANGIKGPVDIAAYGDVTQFSKSERIALSSAGVRFRDCNGGNVTTNITRDLLSWTLKNPPPGHIFLISSDDGLLHCLRMKNYNMLVAHPGRASDVMCSAATIIWPWSLILKGENLIGKYVNYPPDGPLNSCYGDLKVPDENSYIGESTSSQDA